MRAQARHRWGRIVIRLVALCLPALLLVGCMLPPQPMTTEGEQIWILYAIVFGLGALVFFGVEGLLLFAILRYRRRDDRLPVQHHGNRLVEIVWTVIPTVIVFILFVASMLTLGNITARAADPVVIEVQGFQWQWTFRYANGYSVTGSPTDPPVLVVPTDEPVRLRLVSTDVIHSFYVPAFLVKLDVVPFGQGQDSNELEFTVTEPGIYRGQCAEYCGDLHDKMTFTVQAMAPADFEAWLATAGEPTPSPAPPSPSPSGPPPSGPPPSGEPELTVVELAAEDIAFNVDELEVPAGQPFIIRFTNIDSIVHNVAIYDGSETLFVGDEITGPDATVDYHVDALDPGEYTFICDFHPIPAMTGTLTVR